MRGRLAWKVGLVAACAAAVVAGPAAIEQRPLPAFAVMAADGAEVPSAAMAREGKWLLVYVTTSCGTCEGLLRDMGRWRSAALPGATVILVGAAPHAAAQEFVTRAVPEGLAPAAWYADAQGHAREALGLQGAPVVIGLRGDRIQWAIAGVLNDPRTLESALRSWVEQP